MSFLIRAATKTCVVVMTDLIKSVSKPSFIYTKLLLSFNTQINLAI